jgi:hypothetical protein
VVKRVTPLRKSHVPTHVKRKRIVNKHKSPIHVREVIKVETNINVSEPDDKYLDECMKELGIDLNAPRKRSRLPRNRLGLPEIRGGGKSMLQMYREEHGKC